jgi:hypothetical protein
MNAVKQQSSNSLYKLSPSLVLYISIIFVTRPRRYDRLVLMQNLNNLGDVMDLAQLSTLNCHIGSSM